MNILLAIKNEKIFKELKKNKKIKIIYNDIQYKEGILEILEKNKNINYIIFNESLYGQIKNEELIKKIKIINSKIKLIIILNKKDLIKQEYLIENKIKYIYSEEISSEKILEKIFNRDKIIGIIGTQGSGKTIITLILSKLLAKYKNKRILIVEDNISNNSILKIYKLKNKYKNNYSKNKIINIKNNLYLLNIKNILNNYKKDKLKIVNKINKIKNNYDYIFIDIENINSYKIYREIIEKNILILNPNILEIEKIKKIINKNDLEIKMILNNYNENSISEKIINNFINNKIKIIGKINYNKNFNLIINNNFNLDFLDKKTKNKFLKIISKI